MSTQKQTFPGNPNIEIKSAGKTGLFTNYIFKAIPLAFDESMSYYETLCGLLDYLKNTIIPVVNNNADAVAELQKLYIELHDYVENYFDNLDVQEEINNKLDEMVRDGTFDQILSKYTIGKETFRTKLYFNKIGRINHTNDINNGYVSAQAGVYIDNNYYIYPLIKNNSTGDGKLIKLDISNGSIIASNEISGLFHANGCCLKDNKIYITQSFDLNNNAKNDILEIDVNTLEITKTYTIKFNDYDQHIVLGIGYNNLNNKFYLMSEDYFYTCDDNFNVENITSFKHPNNHGHFIRQGGSVYNGYICYIVNSENAIVCFNEQGEVHHIIDIGQFQVNNVFGEIENFNVINNKLYMISSINHVSANNLFLVQFFYADIQGGGLPQFNVNNIHYGTNTQLDIIVDKNKYDNLSSFDKFTCNGTSNKPYESIAEAIAFLSGDYSYTINVTSNNTDFNQQLAFYKKDVTIKGNNCKVRSIKIVNSKVSLSNVITNHCEKRGKMWGDTSQGYNSPLYITYNSIVTLLGNTGFNYENCILDGMEYRYVIEDSILFDLSSSNNTYSSRLYTPKDNTDFEYAPLITNNALLKINRSYGIKIDTSNIIDFKDLSPSKGIITINLNDIPIYSNIYKGIDVALNFPGKGNTDYHKINYYNQSRNIIFESLNAKYMIVAQLNTSNNEITLTPYSYNYETNTYQRNDDIQFAPFFETSF